MQIEFSYWVFEMLFMKKLSPVLIAQKDSIRAKRLRDSLRANIFYRVYFSTF